MKSVVLDQRELTVLYAGLHTLGQRMVEIGKVAIDAGLAGVALSYSDFEDTHSALSEGWPNRKPGMYEFSHLECDVLYAACFALAPVLHDIVSRATSIMLMDAITKAAVDTETLGGLKRQLSAVLLEYQSEEHERGA